MTLPQPFAHRMKLEHNRNNGITEEKLRNREKRMKKSREKEREREAPTPTTNDQENRNNIITSVSSHSKSYFFISIVWKQSDNSTISTCASSDKTDEPAARSVFFFLLPEWWLVTLKSMVLTILMIRLLICLDSTFISSYLQHSHFPFAMHLRCDLTGNSVFSFGIFTIDKVFDPNKWNKMTILCELA